MRRHRRPACVEAATQPRDGCAAGMRNGRVRGALRPEPAPYSIRWCPRGRSAEALQPLRMCPVFRTGIGGAVLDPSTGSRSGKALIPRGTPSGEQGSIRQVAPGRGWTLQVSRRETLEKAGNCVNYPPNMRPNGRPATGKSTHCAQIARSDVAPMWQGPGGA